MSKALDPKDTCVLVTGGAGFIGSHTVVQLLEGGYQVVIVDDLSNSSAVAVDRVKTIVGDEAAKNLTFYEANVLDRDAMNKIFDTHQIDRVIHFAGFKAVGESVSKPVEYYHNNIENTLVLIDVMRNHGCKSIIFSSSSTVYGDPDNPPVTEEDPKKPATNPYGWTKWMIEQILMDVHTADPEWDVVLLRYFNPIGAHPSGLIGEDPKGIPNNLVITLKDGKKISKKVDYPRGHAGNPMTDDEVVKKFKILAAGVVSDATADRIVNQAMSFDKLSGPAELLEFETLM